MFFLDKIKKEQDRLFAKASISSGKCNCAIFLKERNSQFGVAQIKIFARKTKNTAFLHQKDLFLFFKIYYLGFLKFFLIFFINKEEESEKKTKQLPCKKGLQFLLRILFYKMPCFFFVFYVCFFLFFIR